LTISPAQRTAQGAPQVELAAVRHRLVTPRRTLGERQRHALDGSPRLLDLGGAHLREILFLQQLLVGHRKLHLLGVGLALFDEIALRQRLLHPPRGRRRRLLHRCRHRHAVDQLVPVLHGTEEDLECLREDQRMLASLHEHRFQRGVDVVATGNADDLQGVHRINDRARSDREAGGPQGAAEADDVVGNDACG
jgi:hypothetical protein